MKIHSQDTSTNTASRPPSTSAAAAKRKAVAIELAPLLLKACDEGDPELVNMLLRKGADPNLAVDPSDYLPKKEAIDDPRGGDRNVNIRNSPSTGNRQNTPRVDGGSAAASVLRHSNSDSGLLDGTRNRGADREPTRRGGGEGRRGQHTPSPNDAQRGTEREDRISKNKSRNSGTNTPTRSGASPLPTLLPTSPKVGAATSTAATSGAHCLTLPPIKGAARTSSSRSSSSHRQGEASSRHLPALGRTSPPNLGYHHHSGGGRESPSRSHNINMSSLRLMGSGGANDSLTAVPHEHCVFDGSGGVRLAVDDGTPLAGSGDRSGGGNGADGGGMRSNSRSSSTHSRLRKDKSRRRDHSREKEGREKHHRQSSRSRSKNRDGDDGDDGRNKRREGKVAEGSTSESRNRTPIMSRGRSTSGRAQTPSRSHSRSRSRSRSPASNAAPIHSPPTSIMSASTTGKTTAHQSVRATRADNIPLIRACYAGRVATVIALVEAGANPNFFLCPLGDITALRLAVMRNSKMMIEALISVGGAKVNDHNSVGRTPLHLAAEMVLVDAAATLLKNGANSALRDNFGDVPLALAERALDAAGLMASSVNRRADNAAGSGGGNNRRTNTQQQSLMDTEGVAAATEMVRLLTAAARNPPLRRG